MRLHLLGLPHTITNPSFSHCAFTGKVLRFPKMMVPHGYEIIHYGVEGADFGELDARGISTSALGRSGLRCVDVMTKAEQHELLGHDHSDPAKFYADDAHTDNRVYKEFNRRLRAMLLDTVVQSDLVLLPMGHAHGDAVGGLPYKLVESGIGYLELYNQAEFKVFESNAWRHFHQGKANRSGKNYEWVIPNYFDLDEWKVQLEPDPRYVVFLGRIGDDKGLPTIMEIAKRCPELLFIMCGQGDPEPYLKQGLDNVTYIPPMTGRTRSMLLGTASCVLMPTNFTEPFAGVSVEAQLCGTPVLSTSYGAFTETIDDEVTGFRCHTLGDYLEALRRVPSLDRQAIAERARRLYGLERVGKMYHRAFQQLADLQDKGWYTERGTWP
jgi:glycosyltransferase involved in cell wall biosynthesis